MSAVAEVQPLFDRDKFSAGLLCAFVTAMCLLTSAIAQPSASSDRTTAESYVAATGGTLIPAGRTEIDGRVMTCGAAPTVLDAHFRDFGGSFPGFVILNPNLFAGLATPVKLWIFSHECAHQTVGADEVKADCAAVQRGRHEHWLDAAGLAQICAFMQPAHGDQSHFTGTQRCALMKACLAQQR